MFPLKLDTARIAGNQKQQISVHLFGPYTTVVGPNGSGKTQLMRQLKYALQERLGHNRVKFLTAGRIGFHEQFRADHDGRHGANIRYEEASFGRREDLDRRHSIELLEGGFQSLAARPDLLLKIRERLRKYLSRDIVPDWKAGMLKFSFVDLRSGASYPSGREASGLMHLIGLMAALYDDEIDALIVDEPEVSLHPQLQSFLFREMQHVAGVPERDSYRKLILVGTHAENFLKLRKTDELPNVIFCNEYSTAPTQLEPTLPELSNKKIQKFVARMGSEHRNSFFSRRPLLVEGVSDSIVANALSQRLGLDLDVAGSTTLPVIGKGDFPVVVNFLRLLGKSPSVLADLDAIADGLELVQLYLKSEEAAAKARSAGFEDAIKMAKTIYDDFCRFADAGWDEVREDAMKTSYWRQRTDDSVLWRRRAVLQLALGGETRFAWLQAIRDRYMALSSILKSCGCYVLTKGSIEDYYSVESDGQDKVELATEEAAEIVATENVENYADVTEALKGAAAIRSTNEASMLRDLLLAVVTPAVARLGSGESIDDLKSAALPLFEITSDGVTLTVNLGTKILNVPGFPLAIKVGDDVVKSVNHALKLS